jgi:acyl-CoA synthetase (AMP-forming)/AMP-acid ligase II
MAGPSAPWPFFRTLPRSIDDIFTLRGEFIYHDTGVRSSTFSYEQVKTAAVAFGSRLREKGIQNGDKLIVWSENRAEWIAAFWGCALQGVIMVPSHRAQPPIHT